MHKALFTAISLAAISVAVLPTDASAQTTAPTVISVCVGKLLGNIREVTNAKACAPNLETFSQWDITGPQGPIGPVGLTGATGPAGPAGIKGSTGPQGPAGLTGATGPAGPIGATGAAGPMGATGPSGTPGIAGPAGPSGTPGPAGPIGATGPSGTPGPTGPIGATGPAGPAGTSTPPFNGVIFVPYTGNADVDCNALGIVVAKFNTGYSGPPLVVLLDAGTFNCPGLAFNITAGVTLRGQGKGIEGVSKGATTLTFLTLELTGRLENMDIAAGQIISASGSPVLTNLVLGQPVNESFTTTSPIFIDQVAAGFVALGGNANGPVTMTNSHYASFQFRGGGTITTSHIGLVFGTAGVVVASEIDNNAGFTATCIASYNAAFVPISSACQ
jgi:hypothetical protein